MSNTNLPKRLTDAIDKVIDAYFSFDLAYRTEVYETPSCVVGNLEVYNYIHTLKKATLALRDIKQVVDGIRDNLIKPYKTNPEENL